MALDGTYETKLLRILIGFFHVSTLQSLAITRHNKPFHSLSQEEKTTLENEMVAAVSHIAHGLSEEALKGDLQPPPVIH
jgi:hypothetical protein